MSFSMLALDFTNLIVRITKTHVMIGLILAAIGFATILLARRIASTGREKNPCREKELI